MPYTTWIHMRWPWPHLKPQKCISFIYDGKSCNRGKVFHLKAGRTTNLSGKPTKFLGKLLAIQERVRPKKHLQNCIRSSYPVSITLMLPMSEVNTRCSAYNTILYHHSISSLRQLQYLKPTLLKLKKLITRYLQSWLNLPQCITTAALFHPHSLRIKHLSDPQNGSTMLLSKHHPMF